MIDPLKHKSERKNIHYRCEPYPHPNPLVRMVDHGVTAMGLFMAFATSQQAFIIWQNKSAEDVSLLSWIVFLISATLYSAYGLVHKDYPILIGSALLIVIDTAIVSGILLYG